MSFKLTVLGCGSAIPTLKSNPTSQLLNINERFLLIDCGEGTQVQLRKYKINFQRINHIFISHLHGDHYFGLIGLLTSMHLLGRNKDLHIYAHEQLKSIINLQLQASNTVLRFPLFFHDISLDSDEIIFENDSFSVENIILDHTINCSGFIFKEKKFKRKLKKNVIEKYNIPYNQIDAIKNGADWINNNGQIIKNSDITINDRLPYKYSFCTDTRFKNDICKKIKDSNLLYHEVTFSKDLKERADQTGHSTSFEAASIANRAGAKNLLIGHFSKRYKDTSILLEETKHKFTNTIKAESGLEIDFQDL
ncbi:MAG: ribonuclease [Flavobacteriales bacterium]|nr:ribonuclease [Flavobacteriales bacterium]|tara:strand:+ start:4131 stop:5051 length:921 start_codon:yes stop_codon:yes gene_type:complete